MQVPKCPWKLTYFKVFQITEWIQIWLKLKLNLRELIKKFLWRSICSWEFMAATTTSWKQRKMPGLQPARSVCTIQMLFSSFLPFNAPSTGQTAASCLPGDTSQEVKSVSTQTHLHLPQPTAVGSSCLCPFAKCVYPNPKARCLLDSWEQTWGQCFSGQPHGLFSNTGRSPRFSKDDN